MTPIMIVLVVICALCILIGLMLSSNGSTTGLSQIIGQDLELFKKTKDRGIVKVLQIVVLTLAVILVILAILAKVLKL
ncbi:MAG: preprotein translocase subunit SecG [Mycoplasmataceae bacterium]|jgi:preprotein translocase subunit SecG|nr:preprotein translocase subunit SecG [Mycoplasmataceae bacterium]